MSHFTVAYSCPFVPAEWIAAHGLTPRRIQPRAACRPGRPAPPEGVCPYAHAFLGALQDDPAQAVVFTTVCDQMRRAAECAPPGKAAFLMHVPATWQTAAAQRLYADELKRLGGFLVRLGGASPDAGTLAAVMREYNARRSALRSWRRSHRSSRAWSISPRTSSLNFSRVAGSSESTSSRSTSCPSTSAASSAREGRTSIG